MKPNKVASNEGSEKMLYPKESKGAQVQVESSREGLGRRPRYPGESDEALAYRQGVEDERRGMESEGVVDDPPPYTEEWARSLSAGDLSWWLRNSGREQTGPLVDAEGLRRFKLLESEGVVVKITNPGDATKNYWLVTTSHPDLILAEGFYRISRIAE